MSSEVADGSLTGTDVFDNTISGADINGSLTGADVFDNTIGGAAVVAPGGGQRTHRSRGSPGE